MSKLAAILLLFNAFYVMTSQACPLDCRCDVPYEVLCDGQGNTSFPEDIPTNTTRLFLTGYTIDSLFPQNFEDLVNLTELRLDNNAIAEIADNTFLRNEKLVLLSLNNNRLKTLTEISFNGSTQLVTLELRDNPDLSVENGTFQQLESLKNLYVSGTSIPGSYDFQNMENLVHLQMNNCNITSLTAGYFFGVEGLKCLEVNNNQLKDISFLSSLPMLESVEVSSNDIAEISNETFSVTQRLQKIKMDSNNIEILPSGLFNNLKNLSDGSFRHNHIESFTEDIFDAGVNLASIKFSVLGNPINCDCNMRWLASTTIDGQCSQPGFVKDHDFKSMNSTDYQCGPRSTKGKEEFKVITGEMVTIECPVIIDPPESVFWVTPFGNLSDPTSGSNDNVYILPEGNLRIENVQETHEGIYRCLFSNQVGSLNGGPLFLAVRSSNSTTILALSISLAVETILVFILLFFLLKKRLRGAGSSRYRFLLESTGGGGTAEI